MELIGVFNNFVWRKQWKMKIMIIEIFIIEVNNKYKVGLVSGNILII